MAASSAPRSSSSRRTIFPVFDPVYWEFWIGFFLVLIVLFARGGILGGLDVLRARMRARNS